MVCFVYIKFFSNLSTVTCSLPLPKAVGLATFLWEFCLSLLVELMELLSSELVIIRNQAMRITLFMNCFC